MKLFWERKIGRLSVGKEENQFAKKKKKKKKKERDRLLV
jgi:hypothetical protein